jgi:hypothetical protein
MTKQDIIDNLTGTIENGEEGRAAAWGGGGLVTIILVVVLLILIF